MYHYIECGLSNIRLVNGFEIVETSHGKGVTIYDQEGLHEAIAMELCESESPLSGREFRFLRVQLNMSQKTLGKILNVSDQTVANWEKETHELPRSTDLIMRALFRESRNVESNVQETIRKINEIDRRIDELIFERNERWTETSVAA